MDFDFRDPEALRAYLFSQADEKYRQFNEGLIPGVGTTIGVRTPVIKKLAKDIAKADFDGYLASCRCEYQEEKMVMGLVIAYAKVPVERRVELIKGFVPLIDNWAVCDIFCGALKEADKEQKRYFDLISSYLESQKEYDIRFAAVMLLGHFINDEYIDRVLDIYQSISHDSYYVKMAVAWGLSVCYVKFPEKTLELIKRQCLDPFTQNKAIQKCRESFRVTKEDKEMLNGYKIK